MDMLQLMLGYLALAVTYGFVGYLIALAGQMILTHDQPRWMMALTMVAFGIAVSFLPEAREPFLIW